MTEIRRLTVADLPAALELCNEIREHHRRLLGGYFAPLDYALEEENLKSFIADENKVAFAAAEEGRLAGLLTAAVKHSPWLENPDVCHVDTLVVGEVFRRRGIAGRLMDWLFSFCRERQLKEIKLGVFNDNRGAVEFYRKSGFVPQEQKMSLMLEKTEK